MTNCKCGLNLDVGIRIVTNNLQCYYCNKIYFNCNIHWIDSSLFKPLDELFNEEIKEIQEIINEPQLI